MSALTTQPEVGTVIYIPTGYGLAAPFSWRGGSIDKQWLKDGEVFLTEAEAEAYLPDPVKASAEYLQRQQDNLAHHERRRLDHERKAAACRYRLQAVAIHAKGPDHYGGKLPFNHLIFERLIEAIDLETQS